MFRINLFDGYYMPNVTGNLVTLLIPRAITFSFSSIADVSGSSTVNFAPCSMDLDESSETVARPVMIISC
ncbi:unnamed protein product [Rotaria sp. Silwood2]|nr:unnamed protein product [Rotaria sp. Silwood2]CAF3323469.1 unnamed protein product [Rotaria sp. Silwood2]CAF3412126.1 unnamed protein product [Rotaria sp. Silwood2]CAF4412226.1 unnamed protein product [Rotaria sp. Silwood2]